MASPAAEPALLTLPLDLLKGITNELEPEDETSLKATCKRMNLLITPPPPPPALLARTLPVRGRDDGSGTQHKFLAVGSDAPPLVPRDGRSTPVPQSPLPYKATQTLAELEQENREVEDRERDRGMELSDTEDGFDGASDAGSGVGGRPATAAKPTKFRGKNILHWQAELGSAPASPGAASFVHSPRAGSPSPQMPSFTITTS